MPTQYATIENLGRLALTARALDGIGDDVLNAALEAASSVADSYLSARYGDDLPLSDWPLALRINVCKLAAWDIMCAVGFDPGDATHVAIERNATMATKWFEQVASGRVSLSISETTPRHASTPTVYSDDDRGL
jgi:phage gp36-like protein